MPHHLGNTFDRYIRRNQECSEAVPTLMIAQIFLFPYDYTNLVNLKPQCITARKRKYGLFVIGCIIQRQYPLRYGMQWNERLYLCLLAVDADVPPTIRIRPDMMWMQEHYIHIRQSGQGRKDESPSCQFHPLVIHRGGKYLLELLTADIPVPCLRLGFIFHFLTRVHADNLLIDCQIQQAVQPTQAMLSC